MTDVLTKLRDLTETVHIHRNTVGAQSILALLNELERVCLLTMAKGTKEQFDIHKGQYQMIVRIKNAIENGPTKIPVDKEA